MIETFDGNLLCQFDIREFRDFRDQGSKHHHAIVHELVKHGKLQVLAHLVSQHGFDINVQRESDLCTPLHLAIWTSKDPSIAQRLIDLGADVSARNRWGESAEDLMEAQVPIRSRLQGARTAFQVLDLVDREVNNFDRIDCVTAYFCMARLLTKYDAEFNTWGGDAQGVDEDNNGLRKLRLACIDALTGPSVAETGSIWATMMRACAMYPDYVILDRIVAWAHEADVADFFASWESLPLYQTAWGMAKIRHMDLSEACLDAVGSALSRHIPQMLQRNIAATAWAFGKSAADAAEAKGEEPKPHQAVFHALASFLVDHGAGLSCAQNVSNIAWACAKVGFQHPDAFHQIALSARRLMPTFRDQNVANTLWAFAKLKIREEAFFAEAFQQAELTLYDDKFKNHVKISRNVKALHFYQVYQAYCFCTNAFPNVVALLSGRLAADLAKKLGFGERACVQNIHGYRGLGVQGLGV